MPVYVYVCNYFIIELCECYFDYVCSVHFEASSLESTPTGGGKHALDEKAVKAGTVIFATPFRILRSSTGREEIQIQMETMKIFIEHGKSKLYYRQQSRNHKLL